MMRARERLRDQLTRRGIHFSAGMLVGALPGSIATRPVPLLLVDSTVRQAIVVGSPHLAVLTRAAVLVRSLGTLVSSTNLKLVAVATLAVLTALAGVWLIGQDHKPPTDGGSNKKIAAANFRGARQLTQPRDEEPPRALRGPGFIGLLVGKGAPPASVVVQVVVPDGPADKAGLRAEDVLLKVGSLPVKDCAMVLKAIGNIPPGDMVIICFRREGKEMSLLVTVEESPAQWPRHQS
jgi:hypothetical protein